MIQSWTYFLSINDDYKVYTYLIEDCDHKVNKTAMTRVEGEKCRRCYYLTRLHRKTLCYSKSIDMLCKSIVC
ncbi:MAG: IS1 family transposase [Trichodesmium erythraeum GBRTRLIN201]|nr:IS1 family transposase [Trichodesmium erythraeum GBRTRLIN201]